MKRFWDKVDKSADNECWEWTASKNNCGYGQFSVDGVMKLAHRVSWVICNGDVPRGLCVLHNCDNPGCVNPEHLFVGTNADNYSDMVAKGRASIVRGEDNGQSKLDEMDVRFIRYWLKKGYTQQKIADAFGVDQRQISRIKSGQQWGHVEL